MNEPPQLDPSQFPPNQFSQQGGAPPNRLGASGFSPYHNPPPRGGGKLLAIVGGGILFCMVLCGGLLAWGIASFQSKSAITAEYQEHREPIGGSMPTRVVDGLKNAQPVSGQEAKSVQEFVDLLSNAEDVEELVDLSRYVIEMQHSGQSQGVNALTRLIWIEQLRESITLPTLSDSNYLIDFQWLVPEQEARATVASYWQESDIPEVWLLYLTRSSEKWKLYDFRNVMEAASDTQYRALYTASSLALQDNYSLVTYDIAEIYDPDLSREAMATKILAAYRKRRYPPQMQPLAQHFCAAYLLSVEGFPQLKQLAASFDDSTFVDSHYYKGRLALFEDDKAEAFRQASLVIEKVGWHPAAAILAGRAATTAEQKQQAVPWLAKSLKIAPDHHITLDVFFQAARPEDLQALMQQVAGSTDAQKQLVTMIESVRFDDEAMDRVAQLVAAAKGNPPLVHAAQYGELLIASRQAQKEDTLMQASQLLRVDAFSDQQEAVWQIFYSASLADELLLQAAELAPDKLRFLRMVRGRALQTWGETFDWRVALQLLQDPTLDEEFRSEPETVVAIGCCHSELGEHAAAVDCLLPILIDEAPLLFSDDAPEYGFILLDKLADAAIKTGRTKILIDAIAEPESSFVVLASKLDENNAVEQLETLIDWYATTAGPIVWKHYFNAQVAFARGQWNAADEAMVLAIDAAEFDARFADNELPGMLYEFSTFADGDSSTWLGLRLEMAARCGKLQELVEHARVNGELDSGWGYDLRWLIRDDFEAAEAIGKILLESEDIETVQSGRDILAEWNVAQGRPDAALELFIKAAADYEVDDSYDYGNPYLTSAAKLMASTGDFKRLPELRKLTQSADDRAWLAAVGALRNKDAAALQKALQAYENEYESDAWLEDEGLVVALQQAGLWESVNAQWPANVWYQSTEYEANAVLLLDLPCSQTLDALESSFAAQTQTQLEPIPHQRFPGSVCAWTTTTIHGRWLIVGYDGLPTAIEPSSDLANHLQAYPGCVCISLLQERGSVSPLVEMRRVVAAAGKGIAASQGYYDLFAESLFAGDDWQERLSTATQHGINRKVPKRQLSDWSTIHVENSDGSTRYAEVGLIRESVPLDPTQSKLGVSVVAEDSLAMPCLRRGTRITAADDFGY